MGISWWTNTTDLWVLWAAHIWEHQLSWKDKPNIPVKVLSLKDILELCSCYDAWGKVIWSQPVTHRWGEEMPRANAQRVWHPKPPFFPVTPHGCPSCSLCTHSLHAPPSSAHTHILTRAVLLEYGKKPAKDIWGDKLLEAVEELGLVTQLLGWQAFPCYWSSRQAEFWLGFSCCRANITLVQRESCTTRI